VGARRRADWRVPETSAPTDDGPVAEAELRRRLRDCAATRALADGDLRPIVGGLSNRAWRLDAAGESWFVRLGRPGAAALGVDRATECVLLHAVASAGLAPEVLACEPAARLLVTRFVDGAPWQAADVRVEANLHRVAGLLRRLHALPMVAGVQAVSYSQQARRLALGLPNGPGGSDRAILYDRAARAFARLDGRSYTPALCHHDVHHLNLLDDGRRIWLVDWEYGGRGDPLMDLAGFLAMHELAPAPTGVFLEAYGALPAADRALIEVARWAFDYVQWLWYRRRFPDGSAVGDEPTERLSRRLLHCDNRSINWEHG
jgi:thiamine kinase